MLNMISENIAFNINSSSSLKLSLPTCIHYHTHIMHILATHTLCTIIWITIFVISASFPLLHLYFYYIIIWYVFYVCYARLCYAMQATQMKAPGNSRNVALNSLKNKKKRVFIILKGNNIPGEVWANATDQCGLLTHLSLDILSIYIF